MKVVVRIGGSLLEKADWPKRFEQWLAEQEPAHYFAIVGGGELIEAMRMLDRIHALDPIEMHWRCVALLDATYSVAAELLPEWHAIDTHEQLLTELSLIDDNLATTPIRKKSLVRVGAFYHRLNACNLIGPGFQPLESWSTTSDTLALLLANKLTADRLVLLKSCPVAHLESIEQAAREGIIDQSFMNHVSGSIEIRLHQLL